MRKFSGKIVNNQRYLHISGQFLLSDEEQEIIRSAGEIIGNFDWNVVRLDLKNQDNVSLMQYEKFDVEAFPALLKSHKINTIKASYTSLNHSKKNPPILHRKELLIDPDLDEYEVYSRLTKKLEALGAFTNMHKYGTRQRWQARLFELNIAVRGHTLYAVTKS